MMYRCKKCKELYEKMPEECDFDSCQEFEEVEICNNCGEYAVIYGKYCKDCIEKHFSEKKGKGYIKHLDEKRTEWGMEPYFQKEYEYFAKNENEDFLWEYCSSNLEGLGEYIFEIDAKRGDIICSGN